jgi:hypothetical protein
MKRLSISFTEEEYRMIEAVADYYNVSKAKAVRNFLEVGGLENIYKQVIKKKQNLLNKITKFYRKSRRK